MSATRLFRDFQGSSLGREGTKEYEIERRLLLMLGKSGAKASF